ncbi:type I glyceraldehyde-3-phosphate dehydrogenase [Desulfuribacillus alkaliarsenatis]|uniref:Glyceraldehyde-3-phosphate dehydrogenase n=1 Tax=Desulfuribacillus alkaliarsenatis TaxID=766136 RepID=A0A1E5G435_9FIRM|nr:type I glyceraldehyde-3-phosphate dehydrogenase [Desulfuribacillus alkaliarsenatis]OEF97849.1 type I glyceraldehyde-3-phosphate dehydrogenase [Desulfuribacillus alkaliarsenatis]
MKKLRVAINGFGRIGRLVTRIIAAKKSDVIELVAINDLTDVRTLAHLLTYDSLHGTYVGNISASADKHTITIDNQHIQILNEPDPEKLPWKKLDIDLVVEATGRFKTRDQIQKQLHAGAKKVVVSAPTEGEDLMLVMGVNEQKYDPSTHHFISASSCTTTCLAPVVKVLHEQLGVARGLMTTIHSYTNDQVLLDLAHDDLRRARAAAMSMIPTSTGAAKAVGKVIPELAGKLNGMAMRVPTPNVSCVDIVLEVERETSKTKINQILQEAARQMDDVIDVSKLPLVSIDYNGSRFAAIVDAESTMVLDKNLIKLILWYDNEWGYSYRMVELISYIAKHRI